MFFDKNTDINEKVCPSIITGWDHTPRSAKNGTVFSEETPAQFAAHAKTVLENAKGKFVFIKSWNEWAEGNYLENSQLEPDIYVLNSPEDAANGLDAQLKAAVDELLRELDAKK